MVAESNEPEPPPQKKEGIELLMYPMNPDGTWKGGKAPPKLMPKPLPAPSGTRSRLDDLVLSRLRDMGAAKNSRTGRSREGPGKITIRQLIGEAGGRIEFRAPRSESPRLYFEPVGLDEDHDSSEEIIFIQGRLNN